MIKISTPWLYRRNFDLSFILLPSFLAVIVAIVFGDKFAQLVTLPLWVWVVFVMGIDVSHVYSTLYKTYLHPEQFVKNKNLLFLVPLCLLVLGVLIHSLNAKIFWSCLAYLAVFHFIRQQYGFLRLYGGRKLESLVIYAGTLYPIIYWHTYPRDFHWFIEGDFFTGLPVIIERIAWILYLAILTIYALREVRSLKKGESLNLPKNLVVIGTVLSWYIGIVLFNGDFTFTVTNIVAHGIPYMALIWIWGRKNNAKVLSYRLAIIPFLSLIFLLAYVEEAFWAGFVWREHLEVFGFFKDASAVSDKKILSFLVPLLTLPQVTHYILDGFIWKKQGI